MATGIRFQTVYYPESDGKPMGETDWHRKAIVRLIELLQRHFADQRVYVSGDLLVYYEQGNSKKFVVPDVFVVKDLTPKDRRIYKLWAERKSPNAVIEVTSRKTRKKDTVEKPQLYQQLGIREYFAYDPDGDYLDPRLQGHRLGRMGYRTIKPDAEGRLLSQELGLYLKLDETGLQLYNAATGERLLTAAEDLARLRDENDQLRAELSRRKKSAK